MSKQTSRYLTNKLDIKVENTLKNLIEVDQKLKDCMILIRAFLFFQTLPIYVQMYKKKILKSIKNFKMRLIIDGNMTVIEVQEI